jgi:hypothetical protein
VQFTDTLKAARIYNGNVGTITRIDARAGQLRARLDSGREVAWLAAEFQGFRHGYAGTIYKGQGKTLDHTYLYHTEHWRAAASYVALTRQRESAQVFVARETARDATQLARQMARGEMKAASIAWATREELSGHQAERAPVASQDDRLRAKVREALAQRQQRGRDAPSVRTREEKAEASIAPIDAAAARGAALRRELMTLDSSVLAAVAREDRVKSGLWDERPMTLKDAARLVNRDYTAAADRTAQLRKEMTQVEKSTAHYEDVLQSSRDKGDQRWREMGFLRQVAHKTGVRRDLSLNVNESVEEMALGKLAELDSRRAELTQQASKAEKAEAIAFEQAQPAAAAELARRQERGMLAREILEEAVLLAGREPQERRRLDFARERQQQQERSRERDYGIEW